MLNPKSCNLELTHKVSTRRRLFKRRFCYRPHPLETKEQPTQSPTFSLSTTFLEAGLDKSHAPFIERHPNAQSSFPASDGFGERPCFQIGSYLEPLSNDKQMCCLMTEAFRRCPSYPTPLNKQTINVP